jgi:hypothetical protein
MSETAPTTSALRRLGGTGSAVRIFALVPR